MRVYVAGPMRGYDAFNFPAFDRAAERLRGMGHEVCNPADHDREVYGEGISPETAEGLEFDLRGALAFDLDWIARNADAVAVLPDWWKSRGARAEVALAHALDIPVVMWNSNGFRYGFLDGDRIREGDTDVPSLPRIDYAPVGHEELPESSEIPLGAARLTLRYPLEVGASGEVRTVSSSGGEKGVKPARFELIPPRALFALAELYGKGAEKYEDRNWERGYEFSKSFGAMMRHAWLFWSGEDDDSETGKPHMASVMFHAAALIEFVATRPEFDDRPKEALAA